MASTAPPNCGKRLLTHLIDERAASYHRRPFFSLPKTNNLADGYEDISYANFANAINKLATWILKEIGRSCTFQTLVYIGPMDLRYQILVMAAVKTGHVVSLPR
jgi:acyl-CoA synthetase (AMP-forming)/AMP-acid ligase II